MKAFRRCSSKLRLARLFQPPKRPVNPEPEETPERPQRKPLPVVADLLRAAQDLYQFTPQRPATSSGE